MKKIIVGALLLLLSAAVIVGADQTLDKGTFLFVIGSDQVGVENFTFTQLDGGNLKLSSDFKATSPDLVSEFGTDKLFTQEVVLNTDLTLISYSLDSDTERGTIKARVTVQGQVASMSVETVDPDGKKTSGQRDVILEDNAVTTGITGSQFILLQKYIDTKVKTDQATLLAFNPVDLDKPLVEVKVIKLTPVTLQAGSQTLTAQRVRLERDNFQVQLLSKDGQLLGFVSSTATLSGVTLANNSGGAGALIKAVAAGSFAEQAGLRPGDVITEVAGHAIKDRFDAENLIRFQDPSQPLTLTILRGDQTLEIKVQLSGSNLTTYRQDLFPNGFTVVGS
jgi:membrane-associated protease RseP (regulator of RpoE activity)